MHFISRLRGFFVITYITDNNMRRIKLKFITGKANQTVNFRELTSIIHNSYYKLIE